MPDDPSKHNPLDSLQEAMALFGERNAVYKDGYKRVGCSLAELFPDGISLKTDADFGRFRLFCGIVVKVMRYAANFEKGHPDSLQDIIVYTAMLQTLDKDLK